MNAKYCKDCAHFDPRHVIYQWGVPSFGGCMRPTGDVSKVSDNRFALGKVAWEEREKPLWPFGRERCGPEAKFFDARFIPPTAQEVQEVLAQAVADLRAAS